MNFLFAVFFSCFAASQFAASRFSTRHKEKEKRTRKNVDHGLLCDKAVDFGKSLDDPTILHGSNNKKDGMITST